MKNILKVAACWAVIPFLASFVVIPYLYLEAPLGVIALLVPAAAALLTLVLRRVIGPEFGFRFCSRLLMVLLVLFTILLVLAEGNPQAVIMAVLQVPALPMALVMLILALSDLNMVSYIMVLLVYLSMTLVFYAGLKEKKIPSRKTAACLILFLCCAGISTASYQNRPSKKYAGHGFDYMDGWSSTDFSDYMVYSNPGKLVTEPASASFLIDDPEEMPILDGAEACYPLYASIARAVYKDIGQIEADYLKELDGKKPLYNGKIVTFSNSINAIDRLLFTNKMSNLSCDMAFGARPSARQLETAEAEGVELTVTPIGQEAFVFFTQADNPVDNLTSDQVKAIYHGTIGNWAEVGGKDQEILAFQRPRDSGSQTMMEYFMGDVTLAEPKTYEQVNAMIGVIQKVAQYADEKGALGYSFRYFVEELNQERGVKLLSIDGVAPTMEHIEDGTYPLIVDVCVTTRTEEENPNVTKLLEYILSEEGQEIVKKSGYAAYSGEK